MLGARKAISDHEGVEEKKKKKPNLSFFDK